MFSHVSTIIKLGYNTIVIINKMLLSNAIDSFVKYMKIIDRSQETITGYLKQLKYFNSYLEAKYNCPIYLEDITLADIEGYMNYLLSRGNAAASRARSLYILRSFYNYTCKVGLTDKNIPSLIENIKFQYKERTYLTTKEFIQLINAIDVELIKYIVITLFYTGMRISECLNLKTEDIDLDNDIIHVIEGKGGKNRDIPISKKLHTRLLEYINQYRSKIESEYFFATSVSSSVTPRYVNLVIRDAVNKLGWKKKVSAHTLRHSFASNLVKHNVNLVKIQKLLGHSSLKVTSIYTHSSIEELNDAVNKL